MRRTPTLYCACAVHRLATPWFRTIPRTIPLSAIGPPSFSAARRRRMLRPAVAPPFHCSALLRDQPPPCVLPPDGWKKNAAAGGARVPADRTLRARLALVLRGPPALCLARTRRAKRGRRAR